MSIFNAVIVVSVYLSGCTLSLCFLGLILPSRGRGGGENAQLCKLTYLQGKESYGCLGNLAVVVDVG